MFAKMIGTKTLTITVAILAGIVAGSFGFGTVFANNFSTYTLSNQSTTPTPVYPTNDNGQTYGSARDATSLATEPDLIRARGQDGTEGYVRSTDLHGIMPKTPEEALALQSNRKPGSFEEIPLYDVDGKTVIGSFKIQNTQGINKPVEAITEQDLKKARGESTTE
ncbi:hypothetical protein [Paradesulfitobacterium ferrireducens]|uniref:hypothetical protein n=1 Tax=Paradesulfitobacterium ferrireducens TaxID=2816476 RepID=UPI001A8DDC62|nr:hypothetical protein [Paradesulfitobacterium ferrireducens]